jgi:hypothetical protein
MVVNQIMLPGEYNTKGILMSTFELGFTFEMGRTLCTLPCFLTAVTEQSLIKKKKSYLSYNPSSVDRKANGLYSTDKDATIKPVAFGLTLGLNFK